jgi:hypothetical protein
MCRSYLVYDFLTSAGDESLQGERKCISVFDIYHSIKTCIVAAGSAGFTLSMVTSSEYTKLAIFQIELHALE